jgi:hypothetical protein
MDGHTAYVHKEPTVRGESWEHNPAWRGLRLRAWYVAYGIFLWLLGDSRISQVQYVPLRHGCSTGKIVSTSVTMVYLSP